MDYRLEVVVVPVSDVDRAKDFYESQMGFHVDHDTQISEGTRVIQLTPAGSGCSIAIGTGLSGMEPGSIKGLQLVVNDIEAAQSELSGRGVEVGEIQELGRPGRPGFRFMFFEDPDGNGWAIQELRNRGGAATRTQAGP
jgi:catechol 2,3-dioxygenase-like lactoylglutathione lyase family enzyme